MFISGAVLIGGLLVLLGAVIFWAIAIQPRREEARAELAPSDAWAESGLDAFRAQGFELVQIVPTPAIAKAEFIFQDETRQEIGRYIGNINKSATLKYGDMTAQLFIQGGLLGGSIYAGKVGGSSDNSIVIRNDKCVIAEIWRETAIPPWHYRMEYSGQTIGITTGGISPLATGKVTRGNEEIGAFRGVALSSRNLFIALRRDLPDELKVYICSIALLG